MTDCIKSKFENFYRRFSINFPVASQTTGRSIMFHNHSIIIPLFHVYPKVVGVNHWQILTV